MIKILQLAKITCVAAKCVISYNRKLNKQNIAFSCQYNALKPIIDEKIGKTQ